MRNRLHRPGMGWVILALLLLALLAGCAGQAPDAAETAGQTARKRGEGANAATEESGGGKGPVHVVRGERIPLCPGMVPAPLAEATPVEAMESVHLDAEIWQHGRPLPLQVRPDNTIEVALDAAPFRVMLLKSPGPPALRVNAWVDDANFARVFHGVNLRAGLDTPGFRSVFGQGEGMAASREGYTEMYLSHNGFMYYDDERLSPMENGRMGFEVVATYAVKGDRVEHPIEQWRGDVYLVLYLDLDDDKCIADGEFDKLLLRFPN